MNFALRLLENIMYKKTYAFNKKVVARFLIKNSGTPEKEHSGT